MCYEDFMNQYAEYKRKIVLNAINECGSAIELAKKLKINKGYISRVVNKKQIISDDLASRIIGEDVRKKEQSEW